MDGHNNDKKGHKDDLQKSYANPITFCLALFKHHYFVQLSHLYLTEILFAL